MNAPRESTPKTPCPACGGAFSRVLPKKPDQPQDAYLRQRQCDDCGSVYETIETTARLIQKRPAA